jgi:hypothetical protein
MRDGYADMDGTDPVHLWPADILVETKIFVNFEINCQISSFGT